MLNWILNIIKPQSSPENARRAPLLVASLHSSTPPVHQRHPRVNEGAGLAKTKPMRPEKPRF